MWCTPSIAFVCQLTLGEPGIAHLLALLLHSNFDEIVRLGHVWCTPSIAFVCQLTIGELGIAHLLALLLHSNFDEIVRLGHVVRLQARNPLLDLVDPGLVLL
ncbi:hypothetical protein HN51_008278 [Arachis hypogaea]